MKGQKRPGMRVMIQRSGQITFRDVTNRPGPPFLVAKDGKSPAISRQSTVGEVSLIA